MVKFKNLFKSKKEDAVKKHFILFSDNLKENIKNYNGIHSNIIKLLPSFFELMMNLYKENLPSPYKNLVADVISYIVLPEDILPEQKMGAPGYLDDLYLCAYAIKIIEKDDEISKIVKKIWMKLEGGDIFNTSKTILKEIEKTPLKELRESLPLTISFSGVKEIEDELKKKEEKYEFFDNLKIEKENSQNKVTNLLEESENLLKKSEESEKEIRKILVSETLSKLEKDENEQIGQNEELLQNKIPVYLIFHLIKKAKYNNILTTRQRKAFFEIVRRKRDKRKLSEKQINYLEGLIQECISKNLMDAPCEDEPCEKCEEIKEIIKTISNSK